MRNSLRFATNRLVFLIGVLLLVKTNVFAQYNKHSLNTNSSVITAGWTIAPLGVKPTVNNVTIKTGDNVTIDESVGCNNLTIETQAILKSSTVATGNTKLLNIGTGGSQEVVLENNGQLGTENIGDGIALQISSTSRNVNITGSGTAIIASFKPNPNTDLSVQINQSITLNGKGIAFTSVANQPDDKIVYNINAEKTVRLGNPGGLFHTATGNQNTGGKYTYNILGNLDLSNTTSAQNIVTLKSSVATINIDGVLKSGNTFNVTSSAENKGELNLLIGNNGLVDATNTTEMQMEDKYFQTDGEGALMRKVGRTTTVFPVGIPGSNMANSISLSNSGISKNFKVNTKKTFDSPVSESLGYTVNRQWKITSENAQKDYDLSVTANWQTQDQSQKFDLNNLVSLINYTNGEWKPFTATIAGKGNASAPYMASVSGIKTDGIFGVLSKQIESGAGKIEIANILTPNGDGKNDKWIIKNITDYPENEVKVFNRTGKLLYEKKGYENDWEGFINGAPLASDAYLYLLQLKPNQKQIKGYITIINN